MACTIVSHLISFFLWHLTWGWQQLFLHLLFFWFCLAVVVPYGWLRAFWYSCVLHVATSLWLSFFIGFILMFVCKMPLQNAEQYSFVYTDAYRATLSFALLYNISLFITALLIHSLMPIPRTRLGMALLMSGVTSALLVTRFMTFN